MNITAFIYRCSIISSSIKLETEIEVLTVIIFKKIFHISFRSSYPLYYFQISFCWFCIWGSKYRSIRSIQ